VWYDAGITTRTGTAGSVSIRLWKKPLQREGTKNLKMCLVDALGFWFFDLFFPLVFIKKPVYF